MYNTKQDRKIISRSTMDPNFHVEARTSSSWRRNFHNNEVWLSWHSSLHSSIHAKKESAKHSPLYFANFSLAIYLYRKSARPRYRETRAAGNFGRRDLHNERGAREAGVFGRKHGELSARGWKISRMLEPPLQAELCSIKVVPCAPAPPPCCAKYRGSVHFGFSFIRRDDNSREFLAARSGLVAAISSGWPLQ